MATRYVVELTKSSSQLLRYYGPRFFPRYFALKSEADSLADHVREFGGQASVTKEAKKKHG